MSVNIRLFAGVRQSNRPRSQLVANLFLQTLGQVFGLGSFQSRDVSVRLGLEFSYVSKLLSRLSGKPYYELLATPVSRVSGGFENVYTISVKGWGKICYLVGQSAVVQESIPEQGAQTEGSFLLGASRAQIEKDFRLPYLLSGKGEAEEYALFGIPPDGIGMNTPIERFRPANVSGIMTGLNSAYLVVEGCCRLLRRCGFREHELAFHTAGLWTLGLAPSDICAPLYGNAARYLGATKEEIYIALLTRRCIELSRRVSRLQDKLSETRYEQDKLSDTSYDSAMKRIELQLESARELFREFEVEKGLRSDLLDHVTFLHELFLKIRNLESIIPDHYWKSRLKKILYDVMEFQLSNLKRHSAAN